MVTITHKGRIQYFHVSEIIGKNFAQAVLIGIINRAMYIRRVEVLCYSLRTA